MFINKEIKLGKKNSSTLSNQKLELQSRSSCTTTYIYIRNIHKQTKKLDINSNSDISIMNNSQKALNFHTIHPSTRKKKKRIKIIDTQKLTWGITHKRYSSQRKRPSPNEICNNPKNIDVTALTIYTSYRIHYYKQTQNSYLNL